VTTSYAYDVNRPLPVVLTDGTLNYVWGAGLTYATTMSGTVQNIYYADGSGSARATTDANGNVDHIYQIDWIREETRPGGDPTTPIAPRG
jgi:hypothetical protein